MPMPRHKSPKGVNTSLIAVNCPLPVQFDVYWGCSHQCKYCFANYRGGFVSGEKRVDTTEGIMRYGTAKDLADFISGKRSRAQAWCDWDIPIKFGTNSDPFQPCELKERATMKCLKLFAKTGYPFIIITKGAPIAARPEYLAVLKDCNVCFHSTMCCSAYDRLEQGAPTYEERLAATHKLSAVVPRTIAHWQPYFFEFHKEAMKEIPRVKAAGCYGILNQGAYIKKPLGYCTERRGAWYMAPDEYDRYWTKAIRKACHQNGLVFLTSEMTAYSDEVPCCGTKGLKGFAPSRCNSMYKIFRLDEYHATPAQCARGSAEGLLNFARRKYPYSKIKTMSFKEIVEGWIAEPDTVTWQGRR